VAINAAQLLFNGPKAVAAGAEISAAVAENGKADINGSAVRGGSGCFAADDVAVGVCG